MKLHFDSNQEYQWDAIKSITDIFEGQPLNSGDFEFTTSIAGSLLSENGFGNNLTLSEEQVLENVKAIQKRNEITNSVEELQGMNFSVAMETGTGKTYVYAIRNLEPLCTLRYSATHTNLYNLMYSLNPVKAYDLGLVKQIEKNKRQYAIYICNT